ncbi:MAG TPA: methionine adenosyltransferase [Candidatus Nitrosotalea sp.]|nr:methionine adenosyltransferase [Candidatus Nitrosotalea sp.]
MSKSRIFLEPSKDIPTFEKRFEIVERKGIGHPDTICDLVMEKIEVALSESYIQATGSIQHHNMDKALLVAGQSQNKFGGGKITRPLKLILGDRATFGNHISREQIEDVVRKTAKSWFKNNMRMVKEEHLEFQLEIGQASQELRSLFGEPDAFLANDTSALVGYAPLTGTENAVLQTETFINSKEFKSEFTESGEDVKVMGFRNGNTLELTVAMAFVDAYVSSEKSYFARKDEMIQAIDEFHKKTGEFGDVKIVFNNLDREGSGLDGLYLTVLGTSADSSDSGQVGRGNRANQLISLSRPSGSEAIAGKNPVSHIGKIYNLLCFKMADDICKRVSDIDEVFVWMYNIIGQPVNQPKAVVVQPISDKGKFQAKEINDVIEEHLAKIDEFCKYLRSGKVLVA